MVLGWRLWRARISVCTLESSLRSCSAATASASRPRVASSSAARSPSLVSTAWRTSSQRSCSRDSARSFSAASASSAAAAAAAAGDGYVRGLRAGWYASPRSPSSSVWRRAAGSAASLRVAPGPRGAAAGAAAPLRRPALSASCRACPGWLRRPPRPPLSSPRAPPPLGRRVGGRTGWRAASSSASLLPLCHLRAGGRGGCGGCRGGWFRRAGSSALLGRRGGIHRLLSWPLTCWSYGTNGPEFCWAGRPLRRRGRRLAPG